MSVEMTPKPHAHLEEPFWRPFPSPALPLPLSLPYYA